jgi:nicotinate-nucleotide--dimethylbenzimidazole phosphoribosyltransferase
VFMAQTGLPFDDLRNLFSNMPPASEVCMQDVDARATELVSSAHDLGRAHELVRFMAAWQGRSRPVITRPLVSVFAASHGIHTAGYNGVMPAHARRLMETLAAGGAALNQICAAHDVGVKAFELAINVPTAPITSEEGALDEASCAATFAFGMEAIAGGTDVLIIGDVSVGTPLVAGALCHALYGGHAKDWAPRAASTAAVSIIEQAVARHGHHSDPLELLRRLGGRELAAMAGAIMAARMERIPVILDGFAALTAAAVLARHTPDALSHCLAASTHDHPAHARVLDHLGLTPYLDLRHHMEDGMGGAMCVPIIRAALVAHEEMTTRAQAGFEALLN